MSQTDRLARIRRLLAERRAVSRQALLGALEVSPATLKRDLAFLRDNMNTPIVWDRELAGYRIDPTQTVGAQIELPGMWFSDKEIHALLTMQHLLANLDPGGILAPHVAPLLERLNALMGATVNPPTKCASACSSSASASAAPSSPTSKPSAPPCCSANA